MSEIGPRSLLDELARCMRCGFCQAVCPIYREEGTEFSVARGKLILIEALADGRLAPTPEVEKAIGLCLVCKSCKASCPSGVRTDLIMAMAREMLNQSRGRGLAKTAILKVAGDRRAAAGLAGLGGLFWRVAFAGPPTTGGLWRLRLPTGHYYPRPSGRSLTSGLRRRERRGVIGTADRRTNSLSFTPTGAQGEVLLWLGCLVNYMLPSLGLAAIDVLLAAKIRVVVGIDEGCCGMPRYVNGEISGTAQTARRNLDWLARVRGQGSQVASGSPLLFVCPSCAEAWKTYPELLQGREKEAAKTAAAAVVDVSTFLCRGAGDWRRLLREPPSSSPLTVTYHDPCHLAQAQGVRQDPRTLIAAIPGARFQEMSEPAGCCGSGGTFALFNAATARKIGQRKAKAIIATGAGLVATGCPACRLQLAQELVVAGHFVSVRHTVEVLAQALGWGDR